MYKHDGFRELISHSYSALITRPITTRGG